MAEHQEAVPDNFDSGDEWVDKFTAPGGTPPPIFLFDASIIAPYKDVTLWVARRNSIIATAKLPVGQFTGLPPTEVPIRQEGDYIVYAYTADGEQLRFYIVGDPGSPFGGGRRIYFGPGARKVVVNYRLKT